MGREAGEDLTGGQSSGAGEEEEREDVWVGGP